MQQLAVQSCIVEVFHRESIGCMAEIECTAIRQGAAALFCFSARWVSVGPYAVG